jgi:hypothetical protein
MGDDSAGGRLFFSHTRHKADQQPNHDENQVKGKSPQRQYAFAQKCEKDEGQAQEK